MKTYQSSLKAIAEGIGAIYTGSNKESITKQIKEALKHSTFFLHNQEKLRIDELNIARDPQEITGIVKALGQNMCQSLGLPLFLMFEDTANFATANQVMQAYKVTTVLRHRQWLANLLERYWYDPIIADWFGCDIDDVVSQEVKIRPYFEDINFETNLDIITGAAQLLQMDVYNRVDVAKALNNKEVQDRLILEGAGQQDEEEAAVNQGLKGQEDGVAQAQKEEQMKNPGGVKPAARNLKEIETKLSGISNKLKRLLLAFYNKYIRGKPYSPLEYKQRYNMMVQNIIRRELEDVYLYGTKFANPDMFISVKDVQTVEEQTRKMADQFWSTTEKNSRRETMFRKDMKTGDFEKLPDFDTEAGNGCNRSINRHIQHSI